MCDRCAAQVGVFLVAGIFEIGGGWLVWGSLR
jgi:drug/metabolite transporter superfamily protein YnfA